jgi:hypothetical protein
MLARENFDGLHVWDKPGYLGCFVYLVHLVSLVQPNEQDRLADFFSILLGLFDWFFEQRRVGLCLECRHGLTFRKITRNGLRVGIGGLGCLDHLQ